MQKQTLTLEEIRLTGMETLLEQLGSVGMVRFLQQSETGWGDYTEERSKWLGNPDLKTLSEEIKKTTVS